MVPPQPDPDINSRLELVELFLQQHFGRQLDVLTIIDFGLTINLVQFESKLLLYIHFLSLEHTPETILHSFGLQINVYFHFRW